MLQKNSSDLDAAQAIALNALAFIAGEGTRLATFLAACGVSPADLRAATRDPQFLAGVVDYLLTNESLLLEFAEHAGLEPDNIVAARRFLPGGSS